MEEWACRKRARERIGRENAVGVAYTAIFNASGLPSCLTSISNGDLGLSPMSY